MLTQWWANSSRFSNTHSAFSRFLKKFTPFVIMKHSPSQLQTLWNLFQTWLGIDATHLNEFSCDKSLHKRLEKHNNHKQKSSMASNHNFSHSTIYDINRWVRSFDFSTKTNFTAFKLEGIKALRNVKIKWDFFRAAVKIMCSGLTLLNSVWQLKNSLLSWATIWLKICSGFMWPQA